MEREVLEKQQLPAVPWGPATGLVRMARGSSHLASPLWVLDDELKLLKRRYASISSALGGTLVRSV